MIDTILEYRYVMLAGESLDGFKKVRENVFNFRCPICGDSYRQKMKKRGYFLKKEGSFLFYCHNCGASMSLKNFLYETNQELYQQYQRERFLANGKLHFKEDEGKLFRKLPKIELKKKKKLLTVEELGESHPAFLYLQDRKVPRKTFSFVKWTDDFPSLVKENIGDKYDKVKLPKEGIIFELKELDGSITGYQIRSIDKNIPKAQRFVICSINEEHGYFYKSLDTSKKIYVVEGCTDSLFLPNTLAVLSSMLWKVHPSENTVYFNDNEPRNSSVCKQIEKCIKYGYKVVLLPSEYEGMDVNDIVKSGVSYQDLDILFSRYTYSGLRAKIEFSKWKK